MVKGHSRRRRMLWDHATGRWELSDVLQKQNLVNFLPIDLVAAGAVLYVEQLVKQQVAGAGEGSSRV